jgi:hypothetical protein
MSLFILKATTLSSISIIKKTSQAMAEIHQSVCDIQKNLNQVIVAGANEMIA